MEKLPETFRNVVERKNKCAKQDTEAIFLALIGAEAFEVVSNYVSPAEPTDFKYAELTEILQKHYQPTHSEISLRLEFRNRKQQPNESVQQYIIELKKLSKLCGYGTELETNLRDTFLGGLRSDRLQAKLLLMGKDLTWTTACKMANDWEMSQQDSRQLQGEISQGDLNKVKLEKRNRKTYRHVQQQVIKCYRCLGHMTLKVVLTSVISAVGVQKSDTYSELMTHFVRRERRTMENHQGMDMGIKTRRREGKLTW